MNGRRGVRLTIFAAIVVGVLAVVWSWRSDNRLPAASATPSPNRSPTPPPAAPVATASSLPVDADPAYGGQSQLADMLNASNGTIQTDLKILGDVFDAWQTNFPRQGNPVGENADITAALAGANDLKFAFIPRRHPAIDSDGELCDRWGTPFRFHQVSGHHMEIRSAGPDRKFGTADDAVWNPAPAP
jgi:hypothetical protein